MCLSKTRERKIPQQSCWMVASIARLHVSFSLASWEDILPYQFSRADKISAGTHGNCSQFNKSIVRFVSVDTWAVLKKAFPNAIEHKLVKEKGTMDVPRDGCFPCQHERETARKLKSDVEQWVKVIRGNPILKQVLDENRTRKGNITIQNFQAAKCRSRLVFREDIVNFRKAVKTANRIVGEDGVDSGVMKQRLENIAFPTCHSVVYEFERVSVAKLLSSLRSLICRAHKQVISTAVFERDVGDHNQNLSKFIVILSEEEYRVYVASITSLLGILNGDTTQPLLEDSEDSVGPTKMTGDVLNDLKTYHPSLEVFEEGSKKSLSVIVLSSPDGDFRKYTLSPEEVCSCATCVKEFAPLLEVLQKSEDDANVENVSVESDGDGRRSPAVFSNDQADIGTQATNPIVVESDGEDSRNTLDVRVFEMKPGSTLDEAKANLREAAGQSNGGDENKAGFAPRRSSRKRRTIFPVGCITSEAKVSLGLHYNFAAVRLLLYERCEVSLSSQLLAAFIPDDSSIHPCVIDLERKSNEDCFEDIVKELGKEKTCANGLDSNPSDKIFLLHQKKDDDAGLVEASLLDSLLEISNTQMSNGGKGATNGKGKRKRASERGFRGTLLQSSSVGNDQDDSPSKSKNCNIESQNACAKKASVSDEESAAEPEVPAKMQKLSTSDSSDEEPILHPNPESSKSTPVSMEISENAPLQVLEVGTDDDESVPHKDKVRFTSIFEELKNTDRGDETIDGSVLLDALVWAFDNAPSQDDDEEIKSMAYGRYLEVLDGGGTSSKNFERKPPSKKRKGVEDEDTRLHDRVERLTDALANLLGENFERHFMREAAMNAVASNPNACESSQQEAAVSMLLKESGE